MEGRRLHLVGPLACLLLIRADCGVRETGIFHLDPTSAPSFLSLQTCYHLFDSTPPPGYHECVPEPFSVPKACSETVEPYFEDSVQAAMEAGLHYAESCLGRLEEFEGPPKETSGTWLDCEHDCQFFYGELPEGASCESFGHRMSDCAQGLVCAPDRTCHPPCDYSFTAPEGGFCGPARGMWFVICDAGLACGAEGTCEPAASLGAACGATTGCAVEGYCDPDTSSCMPRLTAGGACQEHEQCVSELCIEGTCIQPQWLECGRWGW
jgi:hypothetical protein